MKLQSQIFQTFANRECKEVSPLYQKLSLGIAQEVDLLEFAAHVRARQPIPNLFLAAIHYLLLQSPEEKLAAFYPSISKESSEEIPIDLVLEFCQRKREAIISILQNRIVQTNAVNRTAHLMPILSSVFDGQKWVNLIDIGASSGLNLNMDLYTYDCGQSGQIGGKSVCISSEVLEGKRPDFQEKINIRRKIGIDQNPLDVRKKENADWLKALIWADQTERFERLEHAIELFHTSNVELRQAQTIGGFRAVIEEIPQNEPLAIYHTHVLYQFRKEERQAFRQLIDDIGGKRDLVYLAVESSSVFDQAAIEKDVLVILTTYRNGQKNSKLLATTNGHANWIRWKS